MTGAVRRGARVVAAALSMTAGGGAVAGEASGGGAGEAIYRRGLDSAGRPLRAVVSGDVAVTGPAAACTACHQRSGFGSFEGTAAVPPVVGRVLFAPRAGGASPRPAYDAASLGRALREGVDPAGRTLGALMPRYAVTASDVDQLARYLSGLSSAPSPGVDAATLRLASIVTPDADPRVRQETVDVLRAYARAKNARTRGEGRPGKRDRAFREWRLDVWELEGPEETWTAQLERRYRESPVFAFVAGAGGTRWEPVHRFCERNGIPSILPNLDVLPEGAGEGFYNLYFSPGIALEAEAVAKAVFSRPGARTVQLVGSGSATAGAAAGALRSALAARGARPAADAPAGPRSELAAALDGATDIVLWLRGDELAAALRAIEGAGKDATVYLSSTLLGEETPPIPPGLAARVFVARPYAPPAEVERRFRRTSAWLRSQGIPPGDRRVQDQTLAACSVLGEALMHVGVELVRDYVVELVDHGGGMPQLSAFYQTLAFGPSQRVLSRGCALVPVGDAPASPASPAPALP